MLVEQNAVDFESGSVVDPAGPVFYYNHNVYRAVAPRYVDMARKVLASDYAPKLFDAGLVETAVSDIRLEGYELCLQHKRIPLVSVWKEWSSSMIKDAALMVLNLNIELAKHGLVTKDIQPDNVLIDIFRGPRPIWVDFGSIAPLGPSLEKFPFSAFRDHWFIPLWLLSKGQHNLAKMVFHEQRPDQGIKRILSKPLLRWLPLFYSLHVYARRKARRLAPIAVLQKLADYVENLSIAPQTTSWSRYEQGEMTPVDRVDEFNPKARAVYQLLDRCRPDTVLDMACNKGWFAELAVSLGSQAVAFDIDDAAICYLYERAKKQQLPVLPLVMDFCWPTPSFGLGLARPPADERLRCNTTLVLALVHHLVFKQGLRFEPIARIIHLFSQQRAIVEFVPRDDRYVKPWIGPEHDWYTLDNFARSLNRYFPHIEVHDSHPEPRQLVFCEK
jgi:SAM-dependent methyltransferase